MDFASPILVNVWYARVAWLQDSALRRRCLCSLDAGEQAVHARFAVAHARDSYLLAHALCRAALSYKAGAASGAILPEAWRFAPAPGGKPAIVGPASMVDLHFNLSHGRSSVAVAVARNRPVGIDIEDAHRRVDIAKLAPKVLTPREHAACREHDHPELHFLRHWTLKEAYLKAQGAGISTGLTRIEVAPGASEDAGTVQDTRSGAPPGPWHLRLLPVAPDLVLAAAVPGSPLHTKFVCSDARELPGFAPG